MTTTQSPIRLGQRVYGVTDNATIVPTLVNRIEIPESDVEVSSLVEMSKMRLEGPTHQAGPDFKVSFGVLNFSITKTWFTFDEAYDVALERLKKLVEDDSISIKTHKKLLAQLKELPAKKEALRAEVDGVEQFSQSSTIVNIHLLDGDGKDDLFNISDFPTEYFEPGTSVWVASTNHWQLIEGVVNEVRFAPNWGGKLIYRCGSHSNLKARIVFLSKDTALDYLAKEFAKQFPGTLDKEKVEVVEQVSSAQEKERRLERFKEIASTMPAAREP